MKVLKLPAGGLRLSLMVLPKSSDRIRPQPGGAHCWVMLLR